jgi:hypothetical protein
MIAWLGWVFLGIIVFYDAECATSSLVRGVKAIMKEIVRILNS